MASPVTIESQSQDIELALASYISAAAARPLPGDVEVRTRMHLLDTLVAIISGRELEPGKLAYAFAGSLGGEPEATLFGSATKVGATTAAMANAMAAHADETDDSHTAGRFHPGCGVVPAALAMAERQSASFDEMLRAIALGYDVGARATMALGIESPHSSTFSTHTLGTLFGAAAAAGALLKLDVSQSQALLSLTAQQASGLPYWNRDPDHIEKAFDFGGKGARDGVYAALMAAAGFTTPDRPLTGDRGYLHAFAENADPQALVDGLGERHEIMRASLKKWCVGSPIQSVLDALEALIGEHGLTGDQADRVHISMPSDRFHIINNRQIPSICVQHLAAVMLARGTVSYDDAHDAALMADETVLEMRAKIDASASDELAAARPERQAIVEIRLTDGGIVRHHARNVRGTPDNPMSREDLTTKTHDILGDLLPGKVDDLIAFCLDRERFAVEDLLCLCRT